MKMVIDGEKLQTEVFEILEATLLTPNLVGSESEQANFQQVLSRFVPIW